MPTTPSQTAKAEALAKSQYVLPEALAKILPPRTIDPDGTCKIYYRSLDLDHPNTDFVFNKPTNIAETRRIEFHYNMQPDIVQNRTAYPHPHPTLQQFKRECPVWHFIIPENEAPKPMPACTIVVQPHGVGKLPDDYDEMTFLLLELMNEMLNTGFENVVVRIVRRSECYSSRGQLLGMEEVMKLRSLFEDRLGNATTLVETGEEYRMEFPPMLARSWYG